MIIDITNRIEIDGGNFELVTPCIYDTDKENDWQYIIFKVSDNMPNLFFYNNYTTIPTQNGLKVSYYLNDTYQDSVSCVNCDINGNVDYSEKAKYCRIRVRYDTFNPVKQPTLKYMVLGVGDFEKIETYNIINNCINGVLSYTINNNTISLNLTPSNNINNARFSILPSVRYYVNGQQVTDFLTISLNGNNENATIILNNVDTNYDINIYGTYASLQIINNIANSNLTTNINGYNITININADNTFINPRFTTPPTAVYNNNTYNIPTFIDNNKEIANGIITTNAHNINIYGVYTELKETDIIYNLTNCVATVKPNVVTDQNPVFTIELTANHGFCFDIKPYLDIVHISTPVTISMNLVGNEPHLKASVTVDLSDYYDISTDFDLITDIQVYANAVPIVAYNFGSLNLYKVTKQNLNDLATFSYNNNFENAIIDIKKIYFDCGFTIEDTIKYKNINTNINANVPIVNEITLNFGSFLIPYKNNSVVDYNCIIEMFLPFYGFTTIDNKYLNKELTLKYICSVVSGRGTAQILYENTLIYSFDCDLYTSLIYRQLDANNGITSVDDKTLNGLEPYILLTYYTDCNKNIYNNDSVRDTISNFNGYIECTELTNFVNDTITDTEKDMLLNELKNGVIIENV